MLTRKRHYGSVATDLASVSHSLKQQCGSVGKILISSHLMNLSNYGNRQKTMSDSGAPLHADEIEEQIREVIIAVAGQELDKDADGLQNLNLDSLDKLEILTLLEDRFGVTLTEEVARQFTSISSIARLVVRMRNAHQENWQLPV